MKPILKSLAALLLLALPWAISLAEPPREVRNWSLWKVNEDGTWNIPVSARADNPLTPSGMDAEISALLAIQAARPKPKPDNKPICVSCPCGCNCGPECKCALGGECSGPDCGCSNKLEKKSLTLEAGAEKALAENRPLMVWVREVCPPCEKDFSQCVHVHVTRYDGHTTKVESSSVIVFKPEGGKIYLMSVLPGIPTHGQMEEALNKPVFPPANQSSLSQPPIPYQGQSFYYQPQLMFFPQGRFAGCVGGG